MSLGVAIKKSRPHGLLYIELRLDVRCDRGVEIRDAQVVILPRRFHALLSLDEIGFCVFDRDLVVPWVEIDQRLAGFYLIGALDVDADDGVTHAVFECRHAHRRRRENWPRIGVKIDLAFLSGQ
jgi:hypothetical protein